MERGRTQVAWSSLDTLLTAGTLGSLTDGQLLDHFRSGPGAAGQEAFRILVERHGAMVLGLCRSLVRDRHEAEDAFQATFLVLVRRAASIRKRDTIGPWLHGVASRVARRAQVRAARRRNREVAAEAEIPSRDSSSGDPSGAARAIQEEIGRLPDSLRAPLILCCLEGMSYECACRRLGLREPTLRGRLHRARKALESRLRRRGVLAPIAARLLDPASLSRPPLPLPLVESTTQLAMRWSTLSGLLVGTGAVPESIAALAQGVIHAMLFQTVKVCGIAAILTVGVVGTLVVAQQEKASLEPMPAYEGPLRKDIRQGPRTGVTQDEIRRHEAELRQAREMIMEAVILRKMDENIDLSLPNEVTFDQFLKTVRKVTTDASFTGVPIYVDDLALAETGHGIQSKVYPPKGMAPLRRTLRQTLGQLQLSFRVRRGYIFVSTRAEITDQRLEELDGKVDRLLEAVERLERAAARSARQEPQ